MEGLRALQTLQGLRALQTGRFRLWKGCGRFRPWKGCGLMLSTLWDCATWEAVIRIAIGEQFSEGSIVQGSILVCPGGGLNVSPKGGGLILRCLGGGLNLFSLGCVCLSSVGVCGRCWIGGAPMRLARVACFTPS